MVVLVHGFTQTARSWDGVVAELPVGVDSTCVELAGHGQAPPVPLSFVDAAAAVGEAGGKACYVGYSMGGRLCLRLALDRPDLVQALVLVSASPGQASEDERARRREADGRQAAEVERIGTPAFVDSWLAQPLLQATVVPSADLAARRANPAAGLAHALRAWGPGTQEPLWDRLAELAMPVLLVVGESDAKFGDIAARMAVEIGPGAHVEVVPGAGHAVLLDEPAACARLIAGVAGPGHAATR